MVENENTEIMCPSELILMLLDNLRDSLSRTLIEKNFRLFREFFRVSNKKVMVQDVLNVAHVVDNLFGCLEENELYSAPLRCLLIMISNPPHMSKMSDAIQSVHILKDYFNILGELLLKLVAEEPFQRMILTVIYNLFCNDARKESSVISISWCVEALELSCLPQGIANILKMDFHYNHHEFLIVIDVISELSRHCCLKLMDLGMINVLLSSLAKLDTNIEKSHISGNQCLNDNLNILWRLMRICHTEEYSKHIEIISSTAFRDFMMVLTKITQKENGLKSSKVYRNNMFALLLEMIHTFPDMDLTITKSYCIEIVRNRNKYRPTLFGESNVEFIPKLEEHDIRFERIFLSTVKYLVTSSSDTQDDPFLVEAMEMFLEYLTAWSNPKDYILWSSVQATQLFMTFKILPTISPKLLEQFISKNGPNRFMQILELFRHEMIGLSVLMEATLCLFKILQSVEKHKCYPRLLKQIDVHILIKLTRRLLEMEVMTSEFQKILTYLLCITNLFCQEDFELCSQDSLFTIGIYSLKRVLFPRKVDSALSNRLNVAITDFLWKFVIQCPDNCQKFIYANGVYYILDLIQIMPRILKIKYLALLADICEDPISVPYFITWRTKRKMGGLPIGSGIMAVFCNLWRQEEELIGVRRDEYGCIKDLKEPLMGEFQRTLQKQMKYDGSTEMFAMFADMRIKIFIIVHYLTVRYKDITSIAENQYKLNYLALNAHNKITMKLIENYFTLSVGEIWKELALDNVPHRPINEMSPVYRNLVQSLAERHDIFSQKLKCAQEEIIEHNDKEVHRKEEELSTLDNSCKLAVTLKALGELCLNARIENREWLLHEKNKQAKQIEECRRREGKEDAIDTYPKTLLITTMTAGRNSMYQCFSNEDHKSTRVHSDTEEIRQMIEKSYPLSSHSETSSQKDCLSDFQQDATMGKQALQLEQELKSRSPVVDISRVDPKHYKCFF